MWKLLESLGLAATVLLGMREGFAGQAAPGTVTDLSAVVVTDTTATVTWTGVPSGATGPASYDVRWAPAAGYQWWLARVTPPLEVVGLQATGGEKLMVTLHGLKPQTQYLAQLVAYSGTLNVNAVFGPLSNMAPFTTLATPPPQPPPPPPPPSVATIRLNVPSLVAITAIGGTFQASAAVFDSAGNLLARPVTWSTSAPLIATVDATGLITARGIGADTITATAGEKSASFTVTVMPPPPPPVAKRFGLDAGWVTFFCKQATLTAGACGSWPVYDPMTGDSIGHLDATVRIP